MTLDQVDITLPGLRRHYQAGDFTPRRLLEWIREAGIAERSNPVWIRMLTPEELEPYFARLEQANPDQLPLYGVPFAIKDNIDLANVPTTAACPVFCHTPAESATVVGLLIQAGAIPVGKTNLDQFATGLVGTRSPEPWGPCRNALNPELISGGSSSGSAVAVAKGWVSFSLGTDTAGSGRVPAALNNIVGLKPSLGLLSSQGVVPACRSLDTISVFALTADDASQVFDVVAKPDPQDSYSRSNPYANGKHYLGGEQGFRFAIPEQSQLEFFGDDSSRQAFADAVALLESIGGQKVILDFSCFLDAARLLYEGPWVTERYLATREILDNKPNAMLDVTRQIIEPGRDKTAAETFSAQYRLRGFHAQAGRLLPQADVFVTPTIGTSYSLQDLEQEPIRFNSNLGYYTNFMNLLDLAAISVPTGKLPNRAGFGITLFGDTFKDKKLMSLARRIQSANNLPLGALDLGYKPEAIKPPIRPPYDRIEVVVCGAHLEGLPLNWQLKERGGRLIRKTQTASAYRMYALAGGPPYRPGLIRDITQGTAIEVEVWSLPQAEFGSFVHEIPAPLGIGKVELADGQWATSFICEPYGIEGAEEITALGGWRAYMAIR